jgi:hypothetical protein
MSGRIAMAALLLAMLGCGAAPPDDVGLPVSDETHRCNAGLVQNLVGLPADEELGERALQQSGADRLRWIRPGDAVTMDFNPRRLNIEIDDDGRVARIHCG